MHISRAQWLWLASDNHTLRHLYSLCLLVDAGDGFSYRERRLARRLIDRLTPVIRDPVVDQMENASIILAFCDLAAQVTKRLQRIEVPRRPSRSGPGLSKQEASPSPSSKHNDSL
jgi:hypothetical protein